MAEGDRAAAQSFEAGLAELEALVARLEAGDLSLEEALQAFETGVGLVRGLQEQLQAAERRVEVLTRDAAGELRVRSADEDEL
jgi:exodeoxyribonuclease VII small subunit